MKRGSANIETLEEAGYEFVRYVYDGAAAILYEVENAQHELFAVRDDAISGWQIEYEGKYLEFVRNITDVNSFIGYSLDESKKGNKMKLTKEDIEKYATPEEKKILKEKWTGRLQRQYTDFEEFAVYDGMYGLARRLGFDSAEEAWEANPLITGSTEPGDYRRIK
jgi:hypothetical protein